MKPVNDTCNFRVLKRMLWNDEEISLKELKLLVDKVEEELIEEIVNEKP